MGWREDIKFGTVRLDRLFLGMSNANLGQEVNITALMAAAGGSPFMYEDFRAIPLAQTFAELRGAATGGDTDINVLDTGKMRFLDSMITAQAISTPINTALGLDVSGDQADAAGRELTIANAATFPNMATVGTTEAFYTSMKFSIATVATLAECAFGFRKAEAFAPAIDNYDDMAVLNVLAGDINIETIADGAGTVTTDTTDDWANAETHTLRVDVDLNGVTTFQIDGAAPTVTAALTFTAGDILVPFFYMLQGTTPWSGAVVLQEFEYGLS
ncbi:MAG: hypothetical protein GY938_25785 [Ketobacter sp.]|nr:hypothetical protein [Ketobacter sp.]